MVAAGLTDLCLALPGTIMQTGNYHFNASSIGGAAVYGGGHLNLTRGGKQQTDVKRRKNTTETKQRRSLGEGEQ